MSAHCNDCGADLVYAGEYPLMECPRCVAVAFSRRLAECIREATYIVSGTVEHLFRGQCPDSVEGPEPRDPDCPACQWLAIAERLTAEAAR